MSAGVQVQPLVQAMWIACLAYPWLNPFAGGPSTSVQPWLASALCAALLLALRSWRLPAFPIPLWLALAAVATAARALPLLDAFAVLAGLAVVLAMAGAAGTNARAPFVRAIAAAWLAAACASAAIALLQYFGWHEPFIPFVSNAGLGEAYGNLRQRNQLASHLAIGLASLFWFVGRGMHRGLAAAPLLLLAAGSAASASRTGALQWVMLLALAALWPSARRRPLVVFAAAGLVAYAALCALLPALLASGWGVEGRSVFARFVGEDGCASRRVLWDNVLYLIAQRPLAGWGWGELDWAHYMQLYPGARFCDILDNAHSLPLHLAVELGTPVALLACSGLAWALLRIAPWREGDPDRQLALGALAVILVHSLLEYPLWYGPFQIAFGLALGLLWPSRERAPVSAREANSAAGVAALAVAAIAYAAWDYHRISQIYLAPEARAERYRGDPLPELRKSWLFRPQVQFAELTITPLTRANAQWTYETAQAALHYSPEPRVIGKIIESATLLGHRDVALAQLVRFRAAFPKEHAEWAREQGSGVSVRDVKD